MNIERDANHVDSEWNIELGLPISLAASVPFCATFRSSADSLANNRTSRQAHIEHLADFGVDLPLE